MTSVTHIAKRMFAAAVFFVLPVVAANAQPPHGVLVKKGRALGCIVLPEGTEKGRVLTAGEDLADYIQQMSGARMPMCWDVDHCEGFRVLIGSTRLVQVEAAAVAEDNVGFDGFVIRSVPHGVVIVGRTPQGTANGVYHFAEAVLGVHWFSPEDSSPTISERATIEIPVLNLTIKPTFAWRGQYYTGIRQYLPTSFLDRLHRWWTFNRVWGIEADSPHVFYEIVPNALYDTHPEYFPLIDGKRIRDDRDAHSSDVQRCLSNPDVLARAIAYTADQFDRNPSLRFTSLSANDAGTAQGGFCQCNGCRAMGPTPSHQILAFANAVAQANEQRYPNRGYMFYAYRHTLGAPRGMKAHRNVVPVIAPLDNCRAHSFHSDCPEVISKRQAVLGWYQVAGRIAFHPYNSAGAFGLPGVLTLAEELKFVRDCGSIGGFREHNGAPQASWAMLNWMEVKLMWDVDQDPIRLRRQFIEGYYGLAAPDAVEKVYDQIEQDIRHSSLAPRPESPYGHNLMNRAFLNPIVDACRQDIDAAMQMAQRETNAACRRRIVRDMGALLGKIPPDLEGLLKE